jgi:hypothetical protein
LPHGGEDASGDPVDYVGSASEGVDDGAGGFS